MDWLSFFATGTELPTFVFRVTHQAFRPLHFHAPVSFFPLSRCNKYAYFTQNKTYSSGVELLCNTHNPWGTIYVSAKKSDKLQHTTFSEDVIQKTFTASVWRERALIHILSYSFFATSCHPFISINTTEYNFNCDVFLFNVATYLLYNPRQHVPVCKYSTFDVGYCQIRKKISCHSIT